MKSIKQVYAPGSCLALLRTNAALWLLVSFAIMGSVIGKPPPFLDPAVSRETPAAAPAAAITFHNQQPDAAARLAQRFELRRLELLAKDLASYEEPDTAGTERRN